MKRSLFSPLFVVTAGLLLVSAIAFQPAIAWLSDYYGKEPIALAKPLDAFDYQRLNSFTPSDSDTGMMVVYGDTGTEDQYIQTFRLNQPTAEDGEHQHVILFATYYSDPRDQVPHTPEVCYRQAGDVVTNIRTVPIQFTDADGNQVSFNALGMDVTTRKGNLVVVYVFYSNGDYYDDREKARFAIGWPGDKYTYFSKVEAITKFTDGADNARAVERCKLMLSEALPVLIEEHFPADADLKRR